MVGPKLGVHQARNIFLHCSVAVKLHALNEGRGAIADADDGDLYFVRHTMLLY